MPEFIVFYDKNDGDIETMAKRRASELNARAIGVGSVTALGEEFQRLKTAGTKVDRMLFYTHGDPGGAKFGLGYLTTNRLRSEFTGKGFDLVFSPGARVFFPACDLADIKSGCEMPTEACFNTDNGAVFLLTFARIFLPRGGRVGGSTTKGIGFPVWGSKIFHFDFDFSDSTRYAIVSSSGRLRLAHGFLVSDPAQTSWKVSLGPETRIYELRSNGAVERFNDDESAWDWSGPSEAGPDGKWKLAGDTLEIAWPDGASESWDVPLYSDWQTGILHSKERKDSEIYAELRSPRPFAGP